VNKEITQEDIFLIEKTEKKVEAEKGVPIGFVPVNFSSGSKLGPSVLHFRNYSMSEMLELVSATEDNQLSILVNRVLNAMCYEKFDCSKLHIENIKEIMLTIYANFWGSSIKGKPYYKNLDIDNIDQESNIGYVDIELQKLKFNTIDEKFKTPFSIIDDITKKRVKFILPTVEHMFVSEKYVKEKYFKQDEKFFITKNLLNTKKELTEKGLYEEAAKIKINVDEEKEIEELENNKSKDYLRITQAQLIYGVEDRVFKTLEEKLNAFHEEVDSTTWVRFTETVQKYATFGVDSDYEFTVDGKKISRRFSFQFVDLVPSMDQKRDTGYTVSFDD